jgi:YXWGXW repeat-containing protein
LGGRSFAEEPFIQPELWNMRVRTKLLSLLLIAAGTVAASGTSYAAVVVDIDVAPPPAQVEVVPAPRAGFVWAPGYWRWDGGHHVWVGGRWMHERVGYHWVPEAWVQVGPHWHFQRGHWAR